MIPWNGDGGCRLNFWFGLDSSLGSEWGLGFRFGIRIATGMRGQGTGRYIFYGGVSDEGEIFLVGWSGGCLSWKAR